MNHIAISGEIVKAIELRATRNGSKVVNFTVAVARDDVPEIVDYLDCVAFDDMAVQISEKFKSGDTAIVTGNMTTHSNEKDGVRRKFHEIRVKTMENERSKIG